jgi:hypothetical protein
MRIFKHKAFENLGQPAPLSEASKRLYADGKGIEFVIHSFVIDLSQVKPMTMPEMRIGTGLLSHPKYLNDAYHFRMLFKWHEEENIQTDGKTIYILKQDALSRLYYLEKK